MLSLHSIPNAFTKGECEVILKSTDRVIVQIEKLRYGVAGFPIIKQQDRIRTTRKAMIFTLTAHARDKLTSLRRGKKTGPDHAFT